MSSFAEEFLFCKSGHLGPDQLWSQMSSFVEYIFFYKLGHFGPWLIWS